MNIKLHLTQTYIFILSSPVCTRYVSRDPFNIELSSAARHLLRMTSDGDDLRVSATRLDTIVAKYTTTMRTMSSVEQPLFERTLTKIDQVC